MICRVDLHASSYDQSTYIHLPLLSSRGRCSQATSLCACLVLAHCNIYVWLTHIQYIQINMHVYMGHHRVTIFWLGVGTGCCPWFTQSYLQPTCIHAMYVLHLFVVFSCLLAGMLWNVAYMYAASFDDVNKWQIDFTRFHAMPQQLLKWYAWHVWVVLLLHDGLVSEGGSSRQFIRLSIQHSCSVIVQHAVCWVHSMPWPWGTKLYAVIVAQ